MRSMLVDAILLAVEVLVLVRLLKPVLNQYQELILFVIIALSFWRRA